MPTDYQNLVGALSSAQEGNGSAVESGFVTASATSSSAAGAGRSGGSEGGAALTVFIGAGVLISIVVGGLAAFL